MADNTLCVSLKVPNGKIAKKRSARPLRKWGIPLLLSDKSELSDKSDIQSENKVPTKKVYAKMRSYYSLSAEFPAVIRYANGVPVEWTLLTAYPFFERINGVF